MTISAYPCQWPEGWKRTPTANRRDGRFGKAREKVGSDKWLPFREVTMADAVGRVLTELERMAVLRDDVVISTNVRTRLDGFPRGDQAKPADPGAAVYWQESTGDRRVMAIDQYTRVEDNIAAIAATLEAMRAIERHGGATILARAFTGFVALPAPGETVKREWWEALGVPRDATREAVKAAYRALASKHHPDKPGGTHERMAELNAAQDAALLECIT